MSNFIWYVRFDDGSGFEVVGKDAVTAACAAVKLHNASVVEYDNAGGKLAPVNRVNSRNILVLERRFTRVDAAQPGAAGGAR